MVGQGQQMKVKHNTPDLLIVGETPWLIAIALSIGTLMFAGAGTSMMLQGEWAGFAFVGGSAFWMLFFYLFVRRVQVVFHGPEGWVEIRRRNLRRYIKVRYDIAEISKAIYQTSQGESGSTHRVVLILPTGESAGQIPLTEHFTSGRGAQKTTKAINSWLDSYRRAT